MEHNQSFLNEYFSNQWHHGNGDIAKCIDSGLQLADKILPNEYVIDVGCGTNPFKGIIPNLVGIDPAFNEADIKCSIEQFNTDKLFDVAFCLGSINFGTVDVIENQISKIVSILKPTSRIYWRCNPGRRDHVEVDNSMQQNVPFYNWSISEHVRLSNKFGFDLITAHPDKRIDDKFRIYAEWSR